MKNKIVAAGVITAILGTATYFAATTQPDCNHNNYAGSFESQMSGQGTPAVVDKLYEISSRLEGSKWDKYEESDHIPSKARVCGMQITMKSDNTRIIAVYGVWKHNGEVMYQPIYVEEM